MLDFTYEGNPAELPGLTLAYIGDAVYEMYVRQELLKKSTTAHKLHEMAIRLVNNNSQAALFRKLEPEFTDIEQSVAHRGRNTKGKVPRNADVLTYRIATAMEAVIGYTYLTKNEERLQWMLSQLNIETEGK